MCKMGLVLILLLGIFSTEIVWAQDAASDASTDPAIEVAEKSSDADQSVASGSQAATDGVEKTAQDDIKPADSSAAESKTDDLGDAIAKLKTQLEAQSKQIEALQQRHAKVVASGQTEIEKQDQQIEDQAKQIDIQRQAMQSLQQQVDQLAVDAEKTLSEGQKQLRTRLETVEDSIKSSQQADSTLYDIDSFPGSFPISGSSAALKIGGFVKMNIIENFDSIGSKDRFIVATIPVPATNAPAEASLTASQSRLNLDLRDTTTLGPLRAFVEGDFAGNEDTFRLRHAYGQFDTLLIGKTWSTFMDAEARPEDLDFEGINGQILVRQPQIRFFPKVGKNLSLMIAVEDTNPQISGGTGISQIPDIVVSVRRHWFQKWHVKSALVFRQLEGKCSCPNEDIQNTNGWAMSLSGRAALSWWDKRDSFQFQLNYGEGYGRYVNDLANIGGQDAVFDQQTGQLTALPVFASYIALQKWWSESTRSTFNYGYVAIDNTASQASDDYHKTQRFSGNFIWSPTPRVDVGAELLFGSRQNKDGQKSSARQLQVSATYRY
jgi:hypothetical protein